MQADFYHYIYKYTHTEIHMLGHQPTNVSFDRTFVSHLWLTGCVDSEMPCFTATGLIAADGLLASPSSWKMHIQDCIGLWYMNCFCCLYACWDLLCFFIYGVCWGSRVWAQECTLPGLMAVLGHGHHCDCQKAMLLLESLPQRWLWRRRRGGHPHSLTSWNNASCCD